MSDEQSALVAHERIPDVYSKEELQETLDIMRKLNEHVYWTMFRSGIGGRCHAFIEFCGIMSVYERMCQASFARGEQFPLLNTHSGSAVAIETHEAAYLAEKFDCIFGAAFRSNPEAARVFAREALGLDV